MPLETENLRHLRAAQGYAELGMFLDADAELDRIEADVHHLPEVLEIRAAIYSGLQKWELMKVVADALVRHNPESISAIVSKAYATRRAESLSAAYPILLEAVERHPDAAILHFNLACYECQRGELEVAATRLKHAIKLDENFRALALDDEDLRPLWDSLRR